MLFGEIERPNKLNGCKEVYFIAMRYNNEYTELLSTSIEKGTLGFFCGTTELYHVYLLECDRVPGKKSVFYASWNDIEPLTEEGYKILEEQIERIKDVREARNEIDKVWDNEN